MTQSSQACATGTPPVLVSRWRLRSDDLSGHPLAGSPSIRFRLEVHLNAGRLRIGTALEILPESASGGRRPRKDEAECKDRGTLVREGE
jgi:hypothetical protein